MGKTNGKEGKKAKPITNGKKRDRGPDGKFIKGNIGGPGRPEGSLSLIGLLKAKLVEVDKVNNKTYAQLLIDRIIKEAIANGDQAQIKNILQYVEGMPKQPIDLGNADGKPFEVNVTVTD